MGLAASLTIVGRLKFHHRIPDRAYDDFNGRDPDHARPARRISCAASGPSSCRGEAREMTMIKARAESLRGQPRVN
jgi:hypothetical protein